MIILNEKLPKSSLQTKIVIISRIYIIFNYKKFYLSYVFDYYVFFVDSQNFEPSTSGFSFNLFDNSE